MLETAEWEVEGNEVLIKVASSATVLEMSLGADAKRLMIATVSGALGRAMKLRVVAGGVGLDVGRPPSRNGRGGSRGGKGPVVRQHKKKIRGRVRASIRLKEKRYNNES